MRRLASRESKDILQLIFSFLTPKELAKAAQVCRFWNEQAQVFNIRASQNERTFYLWFVKNLETHFLKMSLFLKKSELKNFLLNPEMSLTLKILILDNLRKEIHEDMPIPFPENQRAQFFAWEYFQHSLHMRSRKDALVQKSLSQYVDTLLLQLVQVYRVFNNLLLENLGPKLGNEHPHLISSVSPELNKLLGEQKNVGLSLRQFSSQLQAISDQFVREKTRDKTRSTYYFSFFLFLIVAGGLSKITYSFSFFPEGKFRYAPTLFLVIAILLKLLPIADKYYSEKRKAINLLNKARIAEEPEDKNDNNYRRMA